MTLKQIRQNKGWTQDHLAQVSGVSVRTIRRLERGGNAGAETLQSLAAAIDCEVADLVQARAPVAQEDPVYAQHLKGFRADWISAAIAIPALLLFNCIVTPGQFWMIYVIAGWGLGLAMHAALVFLVYRPQP